MDARFTSRLNTLSEDIKEAKASIPDSSEFIKKDDKISYSSIDDRVTGKLIGSKFAETSDIGAGVPAEFVIKNCRKTDFYLVFICNFDTKNTQMMIEGTDYTVQEKDKDLSIIFSPVHVTGLEEEYAYVTGFRIGGER